MFLAVQVRVVVSRHGGDAARVHLLCETATWSPRGSSLNFRHNSYGRLLELLTRLSARDRFGDELFQA